MKSKFFAGITVVFLMTSCGNYDCACTDNTTGVTDIDMMFADGTSKSTAKKECKTWQDEINSYPGSDYSCEIRTRD